MNRKMKRQLAVFIAAVVMIGMVGGCGEKTEERGTPSDRTDTEQTAASDNWEPSGNKMTVGIMPNNFGAPVYYAYENGMFEKAGMDIEIMLFQNGAAINESLQAGEIDLASSGAASVYALGTGDIQWLGEADVCVDGMKIYVRPDSPIASVKGSGEYEDVLGSPETVNGITVLCQLATISQQQVMSWCDLIGVDSNEVEMLNMDYSAAWQAFQAGEADAIAVSPPYNYYCEDAGLINVCSFCTTSDFDINNGVIARNDVVAERQGDVYTFMKVMFEVMQLFEDEQDLCADYLLEFYNANGKDYTAEQIALEMEERDYTVYDYMSAEDYSFGSGMVGMGEFFHSVDSITEDDMNNIFKSLNPTFINKLYDLDVPVAGK